MRIRDLYGKGVPNKILYKDIIYKAMPDTIHFVEYYSDATGQALKVDFTNLNDEIEIIDEPEEDKIKKLSIIDIGNNYNDDTSKYDITTIDDLKIYEEERVIEELAYHIEKTQSKVNELIDEVNKLKENK